MSGETQNVVLYDASDGIARITLNRPEKHNALNDELIAGLKDALRRADNDSQMRVVILSGSGTDFCSGADLAALQKISSSAVAENLTDAQSLMELFLLIRTIKVPVVAAVRGRALAGGCGLATACDMVLAARSSRFGYPEVKIGFVPAMVMAILRRNVSEKIAFELMTTAREISAEEAARIGLVNRVVEDESFESDVTAFAQTFLKTSASAVALTKQLLYRTDAMSFEDALHFGVDANVIARMSRDCQDGIAKFLKR
jgi:methylglutaconyl-CoA hydratase